MNKLQSWISSQTHKAENAVMSKQKSLAFFQSLVLLGLTLLYYVLFCISKSPF